MILWCDGGHDTVENMRRDAALLAAADARPAFEPVLRLFRFEPPGITLGHAQRSETVLDLDRCRSDGVAWAVRPTGGRAIFHDAEWTYSLTARIDDPEWGGSLTEAYDRTSRLLLAALRSLGVPAELSRGQRAEDGDDTACFASTARHELTVDGRKLVGSAQRRTSRALLQQGSVLLGEGHERLVDYRATRAETAAVERERLLRATATAGPWLGEDRTLARWADALERALVPVDGHGSNAPGGARAAFRQPATRGGVRRVDGIAGAFLLTPLETGSYTASVLR